MRYAVLAIALILNSSVYANTTVESIDFVYDVTADNSFDFHGGETHECGSRYYRVYAPNQEVLKRRFAMILMAFAAEKKVVMNAGACEGNRKKVVGWIRVYK